jgi:hypothetical protein
MKFITIQLLIWLHIKTQPNSERRIMKIVEDDPAGSNHVADTE